MATKNASSKNVPKKKAEKVEQYTRAALTSEELEEMLDVHKKLDEIRDESSLSDRMLAERFEAQASMLRKIANGKEWAT